MNLIKDMPASVNPRLANYDGLRVHHAIHLQQDLQPEWSLVIDAPLL